MSARAQIRTTATKRMLWSLAAVSSLGVMVTGGYASPQSTLKSGLWSMYLKVGAAAHERGNDAYAEEHLKAALEIAEKFGPEDVRLSDTLSRLARLYYDLGEHAQAKPLYERALAILEKVHGPDHPDVADRLNNLVRLYYDLGDYAQAKPLCERALAIWEKAYGPDHPDVAMSLNNLAEQYRCLGGYRQARPLYERALAICEKAYGPDHSNVADCLNNLALLYHDLGDYAQAKPLCERALAIQEKAYGPDHPDVATALNILAGLYSDLDEYAEAKPLYERALAIQEEVYGPDHLDTATYLNNLAWLYKGLGEYEHAKPLYERSLEILEKVRGPDHPYEAICLNNLAELYRKQGLYATAKPHIERALAIAERSDAPDMFWDVRNNMSRLLAAQGNPSAAIFFQKQAVNNLQRLRKAISGLEEELQKSFLKSKEGIYRHLADLLIEEGRLPEAQQVLAMLKEEEYFDFIRRDAREEDPRATTASYNSFEAEWLQRYEQIKDRLVSRGKELAEFEKKKREERTPEEKEQITALREDLDAATQAFTRTLDELQAAFAELEKERYAELTHRDIEDDRRGLVRELGHGAVLIHYLKLEDSLRILVTTPRVLLARESPVGSKELNRQIQELRTDLQDPQRDPRPAAQALYQHLIAPIEQDLEQAEAQLLMVSLDDTLRYLPLAVLHDGEQFLVERYALAVFTEAAERNIKDQPRTNWQLAGMGLSQAVEGFSPLPAVPRELESIVRRGESDTDGVVDGVIHLDNDFTHKAFREALYDEYPVLHIASHFSFRPGNGLGSFLVLGDGNHLSLAQINRGDYNLGSVELLTLSACNTAVGVPLANGREIEGFGALAQKKGAKSVLATLWPVADASTGLFMQNLYRLHEENPTITKAEALRQTQLLFIRSETEAKQAGPGRGQFARLMEEFRAETETFTPDTSAPYAHPYYWAPFILMGNWL